jgi:hypothetical protein
MAYKRYASDTPLPVTANIEFTSIERTIDSVLAKKAIHDYCMRRPNSEELKSLTPVLFREELYCERFEIRRAPHNNSIVFLQVYR